VKNTNGLKSLSLVLVVLAAMAVSGSAIADEFNVKNGDTVEVKDGDVLVVEVPKTKTAVHVRQTSPVVLASVSVPVDDEFASPPHVAEPDDPTSSVELAMRGMLTASGPSLGATLGFSYKPMNRWRIYGGFTVAKGLLDLNGSDNELAQFGFNAGVSKLASRTVEIGLFGTASWSYRDIVREVSASFVGVGPAFRINKSAMFFEAGVPIGYGKKFATGEWKLESAIQAAVGFHF
jgi:hypothetical protein